MKKCKLKKTHGKFKLHGDYSRERLYIELPFTTLNTIPIIPRREKLRYNICDYQDYKASKFFKWIEYKKPIKGYQEVNFFENRAKLKEVGN
jgi:hypothetical protein